MRILDVSAGNRAIWFDRAHPLATFVDCRQEVKPDIVADSRDLYMFKNDRFDLAVFDPPHGNFSPKSHMSKLYGAGYTAIEVRKLIRKTSIELSRVLKPNGLLAFKWCDHDQRHGRILALLVPRFEPLFGHRVSIRTKHASTTFWVMLRNKKAGR